MKIKSKSDLFRGMEIEKPRMALVSPKTTLDENWYICPYCGNENDEENCGVIGAEPGCLFCNNCNREFEVP